MHGSKAKYSLVAFYIKRFLRLAPAATVVTLCILASTFTFFNSVRATIIVKDALWSSIFLANFHFMQTGVDYFSRQSLPSPFQHYWSLSLEEQFYLVFPALYVLILSLHGFKIANYSVGWRKRVSTILFIGFISSLFYAVALYNSNKSSFYFSTPARTWEFLLGGITYLIESQIIFSSKIRNVGFRILVLFILAMVILFGGGGATESLLVIVSASIFGSLSILFFSDPKFPMRFLLENKFFIFIGSISYSLYLWHWPLRIFVENWISNPFIVDSVFISATFLLAFLSRKYIELPLLRYRPKPDLKLRDIPFFNQLPNFNLWELKLRLWVALLIIFAMPGIALFNTANNPPTTVYQEVSELNLNSGAVSTNTTDTLTQTSELVSTNYNTHLVDWSKKVSDSLKIKKIPSTLDPSFSKILDERGEAWNKCLFVYKNTSCVFGQLQAARKIVVFGDSYAASLIPAIEAAYSKSNVEIIGLTLHECGVSNVTPWILGSEFTDCKTNRAWALSKIVSLRPEAIIMVENSTIPISSSGSMASDRERDALWSAGLRDTFGKLSGVDAKKVFVGQWPIRDRAITDCVDAQFNIGASCIARTQNGAKYRQVASSIASSNGINFVDPSRWLCDAYLCPVIIDNSPVTFDNAHLGQTFSRKLGPLLADYLISVGLNLS